MQQAPWAKKAKEQITIVGPVKRPAMPPLGGAGAPVCIGAIQGRDARFTGYGEDGVLQPDKPTDMVETDQGPKMLHEGEMMLTSKDGRMTVIPASMLPQEVLAKFAQSTGTQGYSKGTPDLRNRGLSNASTPSPDATLAQPQRKSALWATGDVIRPQDITLTGGTTGTRVNNDPQTSAVTRPMNVALFNPNGPTGVETPADRAANDAALASSPATLTGGATTGTGGNATTDRNQGYVDQALGTMSGVVAGTAPVLRTIANQATDTQGARNNWGTMADNITSSLNPNLTPEAKTAQTATRISNNNSDMATLTGTLAKNAQQLAVDTAPTLASTAEANTSNVTSRLWTEYNTAMTNGDTKTAATIYKQITGKDMDMTVPNSTYAKSAGAELVAYAATRPNESWTDAQKDPEVKRMLQDRWSREHNNDGTTYDAAWGQARWEEATVSPDQVAIDSMHSSPFYKYAPPATLPDGVTKVDADGDGLADADGTMVVDGKTVTYHKGDQTKDFMDGMLKIGFQYLNFGSAQKGTNPDGSTYVYTTDAEGKTVVISGKKAPDAGPSTSRPAIPMTAGLNTFTGPDGTLRVGSDGSFTANGQTYTYKAGDPMAAIGGDASAITVPRDAANDVVYDPSHILSDDQWNTLGTNDRLGYFNQTQTNLSGSHGISQARWEAAGEPKTYDQYQARMAGTDPTGPLFVAKPDGTLVMNSAKMPAPGSVPSLDDNLSTGTTGSISQSLGGSQDKLAAGVTAAAGNLTTNAPTMLVGSALQKIGEKAFGITGTKTTGTVSYSEAVYSSGGATDNHGNISLQFTPAMNDFINSNKGNTVTIEGKLYYIPTGADGQPAPVQSKLHLETGKKGESLYSDGVSWGVNVPTLWVYDLTAGKMVNLTPGFGTISAGFHHERSVVQDGTVSVDQLLPAPEQQ